MRICIVLSIFVLIISLSKLAAEPRVLLIGVTNYAPEVTQLAAPLKGPAQDVALMAEVFLDAGVTPDSIRILTDSPEMLATRLATDPPTRSHILQALDELLATAQAGDEVVIYMAGHGAQIRARSGSDEPDGLDEVFLPVDFGISPDGAFENLIRDDEIGARIDGMISAGVDVWLIADTCHSGSLRRSAGPALIPRFVNLVPGEQSQASFAPSVDNAVLQSERAGQFVGFYGAAAGALAFETRPPGIETTHGLLTWTLAAALRQSEATTYADLARLMSAQLWQIGRGQAEPAFTGAVSTPHMLAQAAPVSGLHAIEFQPDPVIRAGRLDSLDDGAIVQIEDADGRVLFEAPVQKVDLMRAWITIPEGPLSTFDAQLRSEGLDPVRFRARWLRDRAPQLAARVISTPFETGLSVGLSLGELETGLQDQAARAIDSLAPMIRREDQNPDIYVIAEQGTIFMRPAPQGAVSSLQMPATSSGITDLASLLRRAAKSRGLLSVANVLSGGPVSDAITAQISVTAGTPEPDGGCSAGTNFRMIDLSGAISEAVYHCDAVTVTLHNENPWPLDVTPFYLAPDHQVYFLTGYEGAARGGWRIPAEGQSTMSYTEATQGSAGQEIATGPMHLVFFAQKGKDGHDPVDFRYLQDSTPPPTTRTAPASNLASLLTTAGFGLVKTRSIEDYEQVESGALVVPLRTIADQKAGRIAR